MRRKYFFLPFLAELPRFRSSHRALKSTEVGNFLKVKFHMKSIFFLKDDLKKSPVEADLSPWFGSSYWAYKTAQGRLFFFQKFYRLNFYFVLSKAICDADLRFLNVNASKPGGSHDSTIFNESSVGHACREGRFGEGLLIGDSGYACTPYLLTPYAVPNGPHQASPQMLFLFIINIM